SPSDQPHPSLAAGLACCTPNSAFERCASTPLQPPRRAPDARVLQPSTHATVYAPISLTRPGTRTSHPACVCRSSPAAPCCSSTRLCLTVRAPRSFPLVLLLPLRSVS